MSHYHAEVWIPREDGAEGQIETILSPFRETYDEESDTLSGWWDWWQIGGRWKGAHVPDYKPNDDPNHKEVCWLCKGTGTRTDMYIPNECNGCAGTGISLQWPTQWEPHEHDILPVGQLPDELSCYTLVLPATPVLHVKEWTGEAFVETGFDGTVVAALKEHGIDNGFMATVDYHC